MTGTEFGNDSLVLQGRHVENTDRRVSLSKNWRHVLKLIGAVIVVQAFFWLIFDPIFVSPQSGKIEPYEVTKLETAELAAPNGAALASAKYKDLPDKPILFAKRGYQSLRATVIVPKVPDEGLGLLENEPGDNIMVFANGHLVFGQGRMELPENSYHHLTRRMIRIPAVALKDGSNQIEIIATHELAREYAPGFPLVGNYKSIESAFGWRQFLFADARVISTTIGFVLSIFVLIALVRADKRHVLIWLFALTFLWSLRNMFLLWSDMPLHGPMRPLLYGLVTISLSAAWPLFTDAWTDKPKKWFCRGIAAIWAISVAAIAYWSLLSTDPNFFASIEALLDQVGLFLMAATLARLLWHMLLNKEDRYWEAALLIMLASLLALFLINTLIWGTHVGYLNLGLPLFLLAFAVAFFSRNFRLFQSSNQINALLTKQLEHRTEELELAHVREKTLVRKEAHHQERQRIMRDMHDGLGSTLMSMLLAARRGKAEPEEVATGLQSVIDEMRLIIDSIDSVGESLASALATFRERTSTRMEAVGRQFKWTDQTRSALPELGPRDVLHVFRFLQEAVTNALKHSEGDEVSILIKQDQNEQLIMEISDNGSGLKKNDNTFGKGMKTMEMRAQKVGGSFETLDTDRGFTVRLTLPRNPDRSSD